VVEKWGIPFNTRELNEIGNEGWELITAIEEYGTVKGVAEKATRYYVFKRPKEI
jgi:hypothetical protein